ncbi:histidine phosphatase family protein [Streptomyces sp. NBC_00820]|uniref:histidine phosphatase family protein n=1 Tax=Streptomyces sp. NBC_00820 TaxID=2975842 RepID=UPI002ED012E4|nr:histidine phosphatase family protein [Streptomyces sp. NBC_00820]
MPFDEPPYRQPTEGDTRMPLISLVRHGQASFGAQDYDVLSDLGREQAEAVGHELARRGLRDPHLVTGTLNRQRDTARLLAEAAGFKDPLREDPRWNEYDHVALLSRYTGPEPEGQADSRAVQGLLDRALEAWIQDAEETGPAGWTAFENGTTAALTELSATLGKGRDAVVVTSGGVLAALCGALLSLPAAGVVALNRVTVNAAVTTLVVGGSGTSLLTFNDHAHFITDRRALLTYR